jgi:hypothetical protein
MELVIIFQTSHIKIVAQASLQTTRSGVVCNLQVKLFGRLSGRAAKHECWIDLDVCGGNATV